MTVPAYVARDLLLLPHQLDHCNLRGYPQPQRRAPVPRSPIHVEPRLIIPVKPFDVRLAERGKISPRKEFSVLCMPGELEVDADSLRFKDAPWLMGKEDSDNSRRRVGQCHGW